MYISTFCSERIYNVDDKTSTKIDSTIKDFSKAEYSAYNLFFFSNEKPDEFKTKYGGKSIYMIIKERFGFDTYYTNSIVSNGKGIYDSQVECYNANIKNKEEKIKIIEDKIEKEKESLVKYIKLRNDLHEYQKSDKKKELATHFSHISIDGNVAATQYPKKGGMVQNQYSLYEFEYKYLNKKD